MTSLGLGDNAHLFQANLEQRRRRSARFRRACSAFTWLGVGTLFVLLGQILYQGAAWLGWDFLTSFASRFPSRAGIFAALVGTLWLIVTTAAISIPVGVAAAIYLEEYAPRTRLTRFLELNISNLAGVPSIVYGLLGLAVFVRWLSLERSVISGALTMSVLILPVIVTAAREALRAVPPSLRDAALGVGATRWQCTWHHVIPQALPGILTGVILAISRVFGETAPLLVIGLPIFVSRTPSGLGDSFTVLPLQIYNWTQRPNHEFQNLAAAGIIVLLVVLLLTNLVAVVLRQRTETES